MAITHIATGGSIDKVYYAGSNVFEFEQGRSLAAEHLAFIQSQGGPEVSSLVPNLVQYPEPDDDYATRHLVETIDGDTLITTEENHAASLTRRLMHLTYSRGKRTGRIVVTSSDKSLQTPEVTRGGFNLGVASAVLLAKDGALQDLTYINAGRVRPVSNSPYQDPDLLGFEDFLLIPAGGSYDFVANDHDELEPASESFMPWFLHQVVGIKKSIILGPQFMMDSRDISKENVDEMVDSIRESTSGQALVTAGSVKLHEIGSRVLLGLSSTNDSERTVVLSSANSPLRKAGIYVDAGYKLGYSYAQLGLQEPGVYISSGLGETKAVV